MTKKKRFPHRRQWKSLNRPNVNATRIVAMANITKPGSVLIGSGIFTARTTAVPRATKESQNVILNFQNVRPESGKLFCSD
jgi:hypothetical protein